MIKTSQKVSEYELPIKITPHREGGFLVSSPIWAECYAQGDSIDEAILEITAVAQSLIELYKEEGIKIPLKLQNKTDLTTSRSVPIIVTA